MGYILKASFQVRLDLFQAVYLYVARGWLIHLSQPSDLDIVLIIGLVRQNGRDENVIILI